MQDPFTQAAQRTSIYLTGLIKEQIGQSTRRRTGNLMDSVSATFVIEGPKSYSFSVDDPTGYGKFTDMGTSDTYRATERGPFTPNPLPNPGVGGIVPRFWASLDDAKFARVEMFFEEALIQEQEQIDL